MTNNPYLEMSEAEVWEAARELVRLPELRGSRIDVLVDSLRANPNYVETARRHYLERQKWLQELESQLRSVLDELHSADVPATSNDHMHRIAADTYKRAIPILVKWLPIVEEPRAKEWVIRCLTVPMSRPHIRELVAEFRRMRDQEPSDVRWALNNAIGFQIGPDLADDACELAQDTQYRWDRNEIVRNLYRIKDTERSFPILVSQLDDDDVDWVALWGLRLQGDPRARPHFERFLDHSDKDLRWYAKQGVDKLDKKQARAEAKAAGKYKPVKRTSATQEPGQWPDGLSHAALVALMVADLMEPERLAGMSGGDLRNLRGIGPKAIERIQLELKRRDLPPLTN